MVTGGPFSGAKAQPGSDSDHSPPSIAEVEKELELYFLSPKLPSWHVVGQLFLTFIFGKYAKKGKFRTVRDHQERMVGGGAPQYHT
jgi:hypothetical protein